MEVSAALAADLALLAEVLDDDADPAVTLRQLAADAKDAVPSYLGLNVEVVVSGEQINFTLLDESLVGDIRTSLMMALTVAGPADTVTRSPIKLILYASTPGAFTDLAADIRWLTGWDAQGLIVDEHLVPPSNAGRSSTIRATAVINQAVGVLLSRGHTPEQALKELDTRAHRAGTGREAAAHHFLAFLDDPEPEFD